LLNPLNLIKRIYHRLQRIFCYYEQFYTHRIKFINNSFSKQLALTFDDGPDPVLTRQILEILTEFNISATFFLSGTAIENAPEMVKEIYINGHCLGNHGYKHISGEILSPAEEISGFEKTDSLLKEYSWSMVKGFCRPPYGKETKSYKAWIRKKSMNTVLWSLDSYDYRNDFSTGQVTERLLNDVRNGDIILFHDTKPCTPDILKTVLPLLLERKYHFIRLDGKFK
jgi:peptidoglycan/xylan/chitin deacetylase (PgdA/CDA1 family)